MKVFVKSVGPMNTVLAFVSWQVSRDGKAWYDAIDMDPMPVFAGLWEVTSPDLSHHRFKRIVITPTEFAEDAELTISHRP